MERKPNRITIKAGAVVEFVKTTLKGEMTIGEIILNSHSSQTVGYTIGSLRACKVLE